MNHEHSGATYSSFRFLLGAFLTGHFAHLLPYGAELFSYAGALPDGSASPLFGVLLSPLQLSDSPFMVSLLLGAGAVAGVLLALGWWHRAAAVLGALCLAWVYGRNPLIANPSLPVVGWLLVAHLFVPPKPYGALASRGQPERWAAWRMPPAVVHAAWILLAFWYSYSGFTKLMSPSWVDGTAIGYVLENPLARDHFLRESFLALPAWCLQLLTWLILYVELLFAPLALLRRLRPWLWGVMLLVQFGFLAFLNFADLTFPMLLLHALTFDPRWLPADDQRAVTLYFDGECAFCNGIVRFALAEDLGRRLTVAPLQGAHFATQGLELPADDTIVAVDSQGNVAHKSQAVVVLLRALGRRWRVVAWLLDKLPRRLRDLGYDTVGRLRYRLGGRQPVGCRLLPPVYAAQMRA